MNAFTDQAYRKTDRHPLAGFRHYRIRGNDEIGKITSSNTALAKFTVKQGIAVMPTVVTAKQFKVSYIGKSAGNYGLVLTSAEGCRCTTQQL
jgi:hypothetical protein